MQENSFLSTVFENFRVKIFSKKKEFFKYFLLHWTKDLKKISNRISWAKKEAEEIAPATEKAKRTPKLRSLSRHNMLKQRQSLAGKKDASFGMRQIGSKTGLTAAKARSSIVKPP
jgi:hypothetical protein